LAADRTKYSNGRKVHDAILVGSIVAMKDQSLKDNPVLLSQQQKQQASTSTSTAGNNLYNMTKKYESAISPNNRNTIFSSD